MKSFPPKDVTVYESLPEGWSIIECAPKPLGYRWICNNTPLFTRGHRHALLKVNEE